MDAPVLTNGLTADGDLATIAKLARYGDPDGSGWRGDPSMYVGVTDPDPVTGVRTIQVRAVDAHGVHYVAASLPRNEPGLRRRLLDKLVVGDWQGRAGDPLARIARANEARDRAIQNEWRDFIFNEFAPKLHWAMVRDGHAFRQDFYMTPRGGP